MLNRLGIAAKVFGLAVLLLCLTVALACFLLWRVDQLQDELELIARREAPLAASLSRLDEYGLRRRLAFERWFGALNSPKPNQEIVREAQANYQAYTDKLQQEFTIAKKLFANVSEQDRRREKLSAIRSVLDQIEAAYPLISARQVQVLDLQAAGRHDRANDLDNVLNDLQRLVQGQRQQLQDATAALMQDAAELATAHEKQAFWLTGAMTICAVLLGLALAAIIAHRLVEPVRSLIAGLKNVEQGDLSIELPVASQDEVGTLTQSFNYFVGELRAKEQIKRTFGQYIDPRVLDQVILQPGAQADGRRVMTVSFSDLEAFTSIGEHLTATGLVNLLNRHFTLQAAAVQQCQGIIDKFIGDAVLAFWGPPFTTPEEHPLLACRAALGQLAALKNLRADLPEVTGLRKDLPHINLRIGISTGEVVVGNIGSESARSYTVIGDTVNLGQRLETANKVYGTHILVSEATRDGAGSAIVAREIDFLVVKGKTEIARVFEVVGLQGEVPDAQLALSERFGEALEAYRSQEWDRSESALKGCLELCPEDGPSRLFLDRVRQLRVRPGSEQWDGVWRPASL
ncbi:MAG: adenylate/guanylate cyclase domain-containing protein [Deltaproteobacteria bacterium]|nr:MAG: adenylate/guanylate cyclase domain-containing protein [Deltaproteobacteria bacterium]